MPQKTQSEKAQRKGRFRPSVTSPYALPWNTLSWEQQEAVIKALTKLLNEMKQLYQTGKHSLEKLKQYFLFGVNEVTHALESQQCAAVILNKNQKTMTILHHIPIMAALHTVPCIVLNNEERLPKIFGLLSLSAVGIRKNMRPIYLDNSESNEYIPLITPIQMNIIDPKKCVETFLCETVQKVATHVVLPMITEHQDPQKPKLLPLQIRPIDCTPKTDLKRKQRKVRRAIRKTSRRKERQKENDQI